MKTLVANPNEVLQTAVAIGAATGGKIAGPKGAAVGTAIGAIVGGGVVLLAQIKGK